MVLTIIVMAANGVPPISASWKSRIDAPYLANPQALAFELAGSGAKKPAVDWVDDWLFRQPPPANTRMLGKLPIYVTYRAARSLGVTPLTAFYASYQCWTAAFLFSFLLLGARCCVSAARHIAPDTDVPDHAARVVAMCMLAAMPPVLFASKFPVHGSPNEFLSYALLAAAMQALLSGKLPLYVLFAVSAIPCRETNLITLLPLLIMGPGRRFTRVTTALTIIAVSLAFRAAVGGVYDPFAGAQHNWAYPWETVALLYLTFGPLPLIAACYALRAAARPAHAREQRFVLCAAWSVTMTLLIVLFLARVRETRILFILYIYVLPLALLGIHQFFDDMTRARRALLLGAALLGAVLTFRLHVTLMPMDGPDFARKANMLASVYGGFGGGWRLQLLAYCLFAAPALAIGLRASRARKPA